MMCLAIALIALDFIERNVSKITFYIFFLSLLLPVCLSIYPSIQSSIKINAFVCTVSVSPVLFLSVVRTTCGELGL